MKNSNLLNLLMAILICLAATTAKAQLEVKLDPVDIVLRNPKLSVDYGINKNMGVEVVAGFRFGEALWGGWLTKRELHKGYSLRAIGKYYFNPTTSADGFYAGVYAGQKSVTFYSTDVDVIPDMTEGFTSGLMLGYKLVHGSGFMLEAAGGLGRNFGYSPSHKKGKDVFGRVTVGYRF